MTEIIPFGDPTKRLDFATLRRANLARLPLFPVLPDSSAWTPTQWLIAMAGEAGEAANIYKKILRGTYVNTDQGRQALADELADVAIYWDLLGISLGIEVDPGGFNPRKSGQYVKPTQVWFLGLFTQIGRLADATKTEEEHLHAYFSVMDDLVGIAWSCDIDIGRAVRNKFNEVSNRVGVNIFITSAD